MLPLYQQPSRNNIFRRNQSNIGLWYDKFCNGWSEDWSALGAPAKEAWIGQVTGRLGEATTLQQACARIAGLVSFRNQTPWVFEATSEFVTGLGRDHPVENGFAWHHTLAVPYLPGSSVKGVVRAFAETFDDVVEKKSLNRIFGPRSENESDTEASAGSVIFFDAIPTQPVTLKADIMTPHYGPYYADEKGNEVPADWHSPVPIPFLVVSKGLKLQFAIMPRQVNYQSLKDCIVVRQWLEKALLWTGAGAKTAVGYGRFEAVQPYQEFSDLQLEFIDQKIKRGWIYNEDVLRTDAQKWFQKAENSSIMERTWILNQLVQLMKLK